MCGTVHRRSDPIHHDNVCPRWQCGQCQQFFSIWPGPLTKQYRPEPLCFTCTTQRRLSRPRVITPTKEEQTE